MTTPRGKSPSPARPAAPQPGGKPRQPKGEPKALVQSEKRWQRSQRYVWDKRRD